MTKNVRVRMFSSSRFESSRPATPQTSPDPSHATASTRRSRAGRDQDPEAHPDDLRPVDDAEPARERVSPTRGRQRQGEPVSLSPFPLHDPQEDQQQPYGPNRFHERIARGEERAEDEAVGQRYCAAEGDADEIGKPVRRARAL